MERENIYSEMESLNKKFDILFEAFERVVNMQLEESLKVKNIFEKAKKEISDI